MEDHGKAIVERFDKASAALKQCTRIIDEIDPEIREAQKLLRKAEGLLRHTYFPGSDDEDSWASENRSRSDIVVQMLHRACLQERFCR